MVSARAYRYAAVPRTRIRVRSGATMDGMKPDFRPTLDGLEDKWIRRWAEGCVVQV
jgi:hypothetical protein